MAVRTNLLINGSVVEEAVYVVRGPTWVVEGTGCEEHRECKAPEGRCHVSDACASLCIKIMGGNPRVFGTERCK